MEPTLAPFRITSGAAEATGPFPAAEQTVRKTPALAQGVASRVMLHQLTRRKSTVRDDKKGAETAEERRLRIRSRTRMACLDMSVWFSLHVAAIVGAIVLLALAHSDMEDDVTRFKEAASIGTDAALIVQGPLAVPP